MYEDGDEKEGEEEEDEEGDQRMGSSGIRGDGLDGQVGYISDLNIINFFQNNLFSHFLECIWKNDVLYIVGSIFFVFDNPRCLRYTI
jgi:hypothetical protein